MLLNIIKLNNLYIYIYLLHTCESGKLTRLLCGPSAPGKVLASNVLEHSESQISLEGLSVSCECGRQGLVLGRGPALLGSSHRKMGEPGFTVSVSFLSFEHVAIIVPPVPALWFLKARRTRGAAGPASSKSRGRAL